MRLAVYDASDKAPASYTWRPGVAWYERTGQIDAGHGSRSWQDAFRWAIEQSIEAEEPIEQLEFWGHGGPGFAVLNGRGLMRGFLGGWLGDLLAELGEYMAPGGTGLWLRTCSTFAGVDGKRFAAELAEALEAPVAAHTYLIGPVQSGLHTLRPGEDPEWPDREGHGRKGPGSLWSHPFAPRTVPAWVNRIPEGW